MKSRELKDEQTINQFKAYKFSEKNINVSKYKNTIFKEKIKSKNADKIINSSKQTLIKDLFISEELSKISDNNLKNKFAKHTYILTSKK